MSSGDLALLPATELLSQIHAGTISARELAEASLARIGRLDPLYRAFITVCGDELRRDAAALDARHARGERLPLHGLPLAVKDLVPTAGIRTTYGVPDMLGNIPTEDVGYIARLKRAGALIIGKTSTPEYGAYVNTRNNIVGTTLNPWDTRLSSGGSSGGTAVALATGMAALGVGTDLGGSVRIPAAFCGITALRGTPGLIPTYPSAWPWDGFGVPGPMCRTVADLDLLLRWMSGPDPRSPMTPMPAYAGPADIDPRGLRISWSEDLDGLFPVERAVRAVMRRARAEAESAGIVVRDAAPDLRGIQETIVPLRSLRVLIVNGSRLDSPDTLSNRLLAGSIERAKGTSALTVARAEALRTEIWARAIRFFEDHDVLALPTNQIVGFDKDVAAPTAVDGVELGEPLFSALSTYAITMLGWPALSLPCGFSETGIPVGLQLVAPHGREDRLMALGLFLERELRWTGRLPPPPRHRDDNTRGTP